MRPAEIQADMWEIKVKGSVSGGQTQSLYANHPVQHVFIGQHCGGVVWKACQLLSAFMRVSALHPAQQRCVQGVLGITASLWSSLPEPAALQLNSQSLGAL